MTQQRAQNNFNTGFQSEAEKHGLFLDTRSEWQRDMDIVNTRSERALAARKAGIVRYEPTKQDVEPYKSPAHALMSLVVALAPPVVAIVAVGGFVWLVVATVAAGVAAIFAFVAANAVLIGGGLFAVVAVVLAVLGAKSGSEAGKPDGRSAQNINVTVNIGGHTNNVGK